MKIGEISNEVQKRRVELFQQAEDDLRSILAESDIKLRDCKIFMPKDWDGYRIDYEFEYKGYVQKDEFVWKWAEDISQVGDYIKKHILYIHELRCKFPDYALLSDYIQQHREFHKEIEFADGKNKANIHCTLTSYFKLPNSTDCSHGGGDYEIKRTPERVKMFKSNITSLISNFIDYIAELRYIERGLEVIEKANAERKKDS